MTKFKTKLFLGIGLVVLIVLLVLGLFLGQIFKTFYIDSVVDKLHNETGLVVNYIEALGGYSVLNDEKVRIISETISNQVTITNRDGKILYWTNLPNEIPLSLHQESIQSFIEKPEIEHDTIQELEDGYQAQYYWKPLKENGQIKGYVVINTQLDESNHVISQMWLILALTFSLSMTFIIIFGYRITSRYTSPIESATKAVTELAKGNYRARTYEERNDESGQLSSSINKIARDLQKMKIAHEVQTERLGTLIENMGSGLLLIDDKGAISMINKAYREIFKAKEETMSKLYYKGIHHPEITHLIEEIFMTEQRVNKQFFLQMGIERRHFEVYGAPIIGPNDQWKGIVLVFHDITELKKLEQMRKDFVANVSHELKTPVTSLKGFAETLLDGAMHDPKITEHFLGIILKESERLQTLIEELLDFSKIEKQDFSLVLELIDVIPIVKDTMTILEKRAIEKQITISLKTNVPQAMVEADSARVKQVFINLISNAISYTPEFGHVQIDVEETDNKVIIAVSDSGIGIEESEIPRIFERFYRVDRARSRESGGTGLGLAIVKHIIEAHKGQMNVKSKLNEGSTFIVELKKKKM